MRTLMTGSLAAALLAGALLAGPAPVLAAEGDGGTEAETLRKELAAERARANLLDDQKKVLLAQVEKLRDEVEATRKTVAALKEQAVRLQMDNETYKKEKLDLVQQLEDRKGGPEPAIHTKVKAVEVGDQVTMVTLEAGRDAPVEVDFGFVLYRDDEYLGTVRILKVDKTSSVGVLIGGRKPLRVGDKASTIRGLRSKPLVPPAATAPPQATPRPAPEGEKKKPEEF